MLSDGKSIFRYETFGSEAFWGDALQLHKAIAMTRGPRSRCTRREPQIDGHPMLVVSLNRRRLVCGGHRQAPQWLGQPDLNVGAIVSLAPNLKPFTDLLGVDVETVKKVLASWGPGRFDAEPDKDGKAFVQTASRRERSSRYRLSTTGDDRLCTSTRCP